MLCLSRKIDESVRISDEIEVVILAVRDGRVRLGIKAPQDVKIYREEVYQRVLVEGATKEKNK